ncbi:MAG: DUF2905 domain-containing protein [Spirochaetes bacterium]|nr:DUF2905 domain-containing protein [Spirochaetota bacterium]
MNGSIGKSLIVIGAVILIVGLVLVFRDSVPFLRHLGRLPGDIAIQRKNFTFHFPIVTSIILSIIISLILYLISRFR